jgi:hypothetical protein
MPKQFLEGCALGAIAFSMEEPKVVGSVGAALRERNDVIKLNLVIRDSFVTPLANLSVSPNDFKHDISWNSTPDVSPLFRLSCPLRGEKNGADMAEHVAPELLGIELLNELPLRGL